MYFIGIDISKFKHDCAIIDELGDVITPSWSFQNDCEGFSLFRELLDALDGEKRIVLRRFHRLILILSRLVDTFSSRILYLMLLLSGNHSIAVV